MVKTRIRVSVASAAQLRDRVDRRAAGHDQVEQQNVGLEGVHLAQGLLDIGRFADDLHVLLSLENGTKTAADHRVIVGDHDLDGSVVLRSCGFHRQAQRDLGPTACSRVDLELAPQQPGSLAHPAEPEAVRRRLSSTSNPQPSSRTAGDNRVIRPRSSRSRSSLRRRA